jgi:hypothetical protein
LLKKKIKEGFKIFKRDIKLRRKRVKKGNKKRLKTLVVRKDGQGFYQNSGALTDSPN